MRVAPKPIQTFRDDFTYTNSDDAIKRFPFPFPEDEYMYSVNIEPHALPGPEGTVYEHLFDIDEHYLSEMAERKIVLEENPQRCLAMPHMDLACWDFIDRAMTTMSQDYPEYFSLQKDGDLWTWENRLLGIHDTFTFGDSDTLPQPALEYMGCQVQGDIAILDQRENDLFLDAGIVTCPADWSLAFDAGMSFSEWHGPVPLAHEAGIFERALKYLTAIPVGRPVRRLNWTLTINARMDTSPETYPNWGTDRDSITPENIGAKVYLRVELQVLDRMPRSNGLLFSIRTYLISMNDLVTNPEWAKRMHRIMKTLPPELVEYKGLSRYHPMLIKWLKQFDLEN
ncbi:heme-dependent oxidative N-demethylase family protein [Thiomicrorhabdus heinhorstiae]|uniref:DUF3445 domain-containing protein n=1 Tax=Thiomicrorhabdus heinhorstiae TaxID=2748010 RepID=A0ABS0BU84_9GAMM|nr:DUF3445 domain-containing protein [Thiomicrorhabdus heinhorstiae]MBF6057402.1 DUF3445 domain-containing protein [Thiomicrorhabdus heinhorstiae]